MNLGYIVFKFELTVCLMQTSYTIKKYLKSFGQTICIAVPQSKKKKKAKGTSHQAHLHKQSRVQKVKINK